MPNESLLLAACILPVMLLVALRINAALVFLSLCLGQMLVQFVAKDADSLITFVAPDNTSISGSVLTLIMLFLPVALTALIMVFSIHGRLRVALNIIPAIGVGLLGVLLAVPLLTPGLRGTLQHTATWHQLIDAQAMIIGASAFACLLFLWSQRRSTKKDHEKHSH